MSTSTSTARVRRHTLGIRAVTLVLTTALIGALGVALADDAAASDAAHLTAGDSLTAGQSLVSPNGMASITVQTDGNLVVRTHGGASWTSGTAGHSDRPYLQMQTDGNLVLRDAGGAIWQSQTRGDNGTSIGVQDDGNVVMRRTDGAAVWTTGTNLATLQPGHALTAGQYLGSVDGFSRVTVQSDGNVVLRSGNRAAWTPNTHGTGNRLSLNTDGNLVVYSASNVALWKTGTNDPNARLVLQDDGNLVLRSGATVLWTSSTVADTLAVNGTLAVGQALTSDNHRFAATVQSDGNLVVYRSGAAIWQSRSSGSGSRLTVQSDGNVVLRNAAGTATWSTATVGTGTANTLRLQDDGNLVLRNSAGQAAWYTGPYTEPSNPGATTCTYTGGAATAGITIAGVALDATQLTNAMAISKTGSTIGMSRVDVATALMTGYTESRIRVLASTVVPESYDYPHDGVGSDHNSVGIFQQRVGYGWGTVAQMMDRSTASFTFFSRLRGIANRDANTMWANAQRIQVSAYDDGSNYQAYADLGTQLAAYIASHTNPVSVSCR